MRFRVEPRDVPDEQIAKRMGLSLAAFREKRAALEARGFPPPDPDTGNTDLDAVDAWRQRRNPHLFDIPSPRALDARDVVGARLRRMAANG